MELLVRLLVRPRVRIHDTVDHDAPDALREDVDEVLAHDRAVRQPVEVDERPFAGD